MPGLSIRTVSRSMRPGEAAWQEQKAQYDAGAAAYEETGPDMRRVWRLPGEKGPV